jgi:hypothetical protein
MLPNVKGSGGRFFKVNKETLHIECKPVEYLAPKVYIVVDSYTEQVGEFNGQPNTQYMLVFRKQLFLDETTKRWSVHVHDRDCLMVMNKTGLRCAKAYEDRLVKQYGQQKPEWSGEILSHVVTAVTGKSTFLQKFSSTSHHPEFELAGLVDEILPSATQLPSFPSDKATKVASLKTKFDKLPTDIKGVFLKLCGVQSLDQVTDFKGANQNLDRLLGVPAQSPATAQAAPPAF